MLPFEEIIYLLLCEKLKSTRWRRVGKVEERSKGLMNIHKNYIRLYQKHLSAEQIAESLFIYDRNLNLP